MSRWASRPLGASASAFLAAVRSEVPVALIATPRADLKCHPASRWQEIKRDPQFDDFDQVPLTGNDGEHIEAVFVRRQGRAELREDMFMAADAPLISYLESADQGRFRFLLEDRSVSGLVTLSDIQKLPVYPVLFGVVIAVEMLLMEWIRTRCGANPDAWLDLLHTKQRNAIETHWDKARSQNLAIDRLSCASFGQELRAAAGLGLFEGDDERRESLQALEELRHQVCHASEFALTPEQALKIPAQVRQARDAASWLQTKIDGIRQ